MDLAGHFGTLYVPSPRRDPRQCRRQDPYEAGKIINIGQKFRIFVFSCIFVIQDILSSVKLYRGDTADTGTDIGGVGGQV